MASKTNFPPKESVRHVTQLFVFQMSKYLTGYTKIADSSFLFCDTEHMLSTSASIVTAVGGYSGDNILFSFNLAIHSVVVGNWPQPINGPLRGSVQI